MNTWFSKNKALLLEEFFSFLRFKSVSADPYYSDEVEGCARWLERHLKKIGLDSELLSTEGYPIVFAKNRDFDEDKPAILIYGHYDVQPADPLSEWKTDPFDPQVIDGKIYARGALDDKGQIFYAMSAVRFFLEKYSRDKSSLGKASLPFNIKFCIEGEEESSSRGLKKALDDYRDILKADYLFAVDFNALSENTPAITLGARGMVTMTLEFIGSKVDMHSGEFGGIAYNPLKACAQVLSKLWDEKGRINIPGFYDEVKVIDKKNISSFFDKEKYEKEFGLRALHSEEGFSPLESNWFRPTIEINGIGGGYFDVGFKSVIPRKVVCKLSSRIVKDQNPEKVALLIKDFLQKQTKKGIDLKIEVIDGEKAISGDRNGRLTLALAKAMEGVYGRPCEYIYCGGSVPIVGVMVDKLKAEPTMMGVGLATDNIHAPNEHFSLTRFEKGFLSVANALDLFGRECKIKC